MIRFVVVEILWVVYLVGILVICLHHLSVSIFEKAEPFHKQRSLLASVGFAVIWPLALFSSEGRSELKHKITKLL